MSDVRRWIGLAVGLLALAAPARAMEPVTVRADGFYEAASGRAFVPFGFNYFDPQTGWAPQVWRQFDEGRIRAQFETMRALGVNAVRVFLAAATFQPEPDRIDEAALRKMDTLVAIAREHGIRIIFTGPDHWEGSPRYWRPDRFCGEPALAALDRFWSVVARRYAAEPAILAWDLLNEPMIPWSTPVMSGRWGGWLKARYGGDPARLRQAWGADAPTTVTWASLATPENKPAPGSGRLLDYQRFREEIADAWVERQVAAIRAADTLHPITVGYIQWSYPFYRAEQPGMYSAFSPRRQAKLLDFIAVHFYPQGGDPCASTENAARSRDYLRAVLAWCHAGKPVFLEEFGWHGGAGPKRDSQTAAEAQGQAHYLGEVVEASRPLTRGWSAWPLADTPSSRDLTRYAGALTSELKMKPWGETFKAFAGKLAELERPAPPLPTMDDAAGLTANAAGLRKLHEAYAGKVKAALGE